MRFAVEADGAVVLPEVHPLAADGVYASAALVELAAQLAGPQVQVPSADEGSAPQAGRSGMLVEVRDLVLRVDAVRAGARLVPEIAVERAEAPLPRFFVRLPGVLDVRLTLLVR